MEKKKVRKQLLNGLKILVSAGAVIYVLHKIDIARLGEAFSSVKWFLLFFALLFFIASKIISAIRLNLCFGSVEVKITQISNFKLYLLGMFYNLFLPGGIGGDGYKIWLLHKEGGGSLKKLTAAVLHDRVNGLFAIGLIVFILLFLLPLPENVKYFSPFVLVVVIVIYAVILKRIFPWFYSGIFSVTGLSLIVQGLQIIALIFIALSMGIKSQFISLVFIFLVSSAVSVLPITIGGAGARELVFLYGSKILGLEVSIAVAISFVFFVITSITSFTGIFYSIRKPGVKFIQ